MKKVLDVMSQSLHLSLATTGCQGEMFIPQPAAEWLLEVRKLVSSKAVSFPFGVTLFSFSTSRQAFADKPVSSMKSMNDD